jgi:hypothetical protein
MNISVLAQRQAKARQVLRRACRTIARSPFEGVPLSAAAQSMLSTVWRLYAPELLLAYPLASLKDTDVAAFEASVHQRLQQDGRVLLQPHIQAYLQAQAEQLTQLQTGLTRVEAQRQRALTDMASVLREYAPRPPKPRRYSPGSQRLREFLDEDETQMTVPEGFIHWSGAKVCLTNDPRRRARQSVDLSGGRRQMLMTSGGGSDYVVFREQPAALIGVFNALVRLSEETTLPCNRFQFYGALAQAALTAIQAAEAQGQVADDPTLILAVLGRAHDLFFAEVASRREQLAQLSRRHALGGVGVS